MYERILVPLDGSPTSRRGLEEAVAVAAKFGSRLRLVHVVDDAVFAWAGEAAAASNIGDLLTQLAESGEKLLSDAKRDLQKQGLTVETVQHHSISGRVCDVIIQEAADWKADLIVIGTHGRRGAGRLLLGSDAEQVLRLSPVPVLLVRDRSGVG